MTDKEINQIKSRLEKTTSGPWTSWIEGRDHTSGDSFIMTGEEDKRGPDIYISGGTTADQDFIAASRQDIPTLLNEIDKLKKEIEKLRNSG